MKQVRPKKNLGQHFLTDLSIARRIADTVDACPDIPVLEVGTGMGVMTQYLVEKPRQLKVVEIDAESVAYLKGTLFKPHPQPLPDWGGEYIENSVSPCLCGEKKEGSEERGERIDFPLPISSQLWLVLLYSLSFKLFLNPDSSLPISTDILSALVCSVSVIYPNDCAISSWQLTSVREP